MTCERCGYETPPESYELLDYCRHCSKNLCDGCMESGWCAESADHKHRPEADDE